MTTAWPLAQGLLDSPVSLLTASAKPSLVLGQVNGDTIGQRLGEGFALMIVGMVIVFIGLVVLYGVVQLLKALLNHPEDQQGKSADATRAATVQMTPKPRVTPAPAPPAQATTQATPAPTPAPTAQATSAPAPTAQTTAQATPAPTPAPAAQATPAPAPAVPTPQPDAEPLRAGAATTGGSQMVDGELLAIVTAAATALLRRRIRIRRVRFVGPTPAAAWAIQGRTRHMGSHQPHMRRTR